MEKNFVLTLTLKFNDEDLDLNIKTASEGIETAKEAAIAVFFKEALMKQAELAANQALEIGSLVDTISSLSEEE